MTSGRWAVLIPVVILALMIGVAEPFPGLSSQGHRVLGLIMVSLGLWIFRSPALPYLTGAALLLGGYFGMVKTVH